MLIIVYRAAKPQGKIRKISPFYFAFSGRITHLQCDLEGLGSTQLLIVAQSHHQHQTKGGADALRQFAEEAVQRIGRALLALAGFPLVVVDTLYNDYLLAAGEITTEQQEQALVVEMLQQYCDRVARYSTAGYSVVIRNIIHYINLHLKEDLTLSTLAARFNLSRSYLSDRFHREVHSNLTDYVTLTCIQFAANLLRYHHYTITQAAQEVGIPDVPYFTRLFKRTMGETPSQYARKKAIES